MIVPYGLQKNLSVKLKGFFILQQAPGATANKLPQDCNPIVICSSGVGFAVSSTIFV